MIRTTLIAAALFAMAGTASAAQQCGAQTHERFDETRAYFDHVLGACRPDGYCSAVVALTASDGSVYAQQLRIARPTPGADYEVELVAVQPMNTGDGQPMSLAFGRHAIDLQGLALPPPRNINLFLITDTKTVGDIVRSARGARTMRWTYQTEGGPASAWFALGGMTAALTWIDCVGAAR